MELADSFAASAVRDRSVAWEMNIGVELLNSSTHRALLSVQRGTKSRDRAVRSQQILGGAAILTRGFSYMSV